MTQMTQMTQALKDAGVALPPMNRRIWQWLYDKHGGYTSAEPATALNLPPNTVAAILADMDTRGMVRAGASTRMTKTKQGRRPKEWFAVGNKFELLPVKQEFKVPTLAQMRKQSLGPVPATVPTTTSQPAAPAPAINVEDGMTLAEARALYLRLHKIFGGAQ